MRLGLDLRSYASTDLLARVREADKLGIWAVLIGGAPGTEVMIATQLATATSHVHLAVAVDAGTEHPLTIAEDVAVLDHLSERRALAVIDAEPEVSSLVQRLLAGHIVDGVALAPPPAQAAVPVWPLASLDTVTLSGSLDQDRSEIDRQRDHGVTHLFASFPGSAHVFARHLVTRARTAEFPQVVADHADAIAPLATPTKGSGNAAR